MQPKDKAPSYKPASRDTIRANKGKIVADSSFYRIEFKNINPDTIFNEREDYGDLRDLADSIHEHGLFQPLIGTIVDKGKGIMLDLTDGFRRYAALKLLVNEGKEVGQILCRHKIMSIQDRLLGMCEMGNTSKSFNPIETARIYSRLINLGMPIKELCNRARKTETHINYMLELNKQSSTTKEAIKHKRTSATAVVKISQKLGPDGATQAVNDANAQNRKLTVNDADEAVKDQTKKRSAIDYDTIPADLDGMIRLRDTLLSLKSRTKDQLRTINVLDAKIKIRQDAMDIPKEPAFPIEFDTKLETEFKAIFCPAIGLDLCGDIYTWFESRLKR